MVVALLLYLYSLILCVEIPVYHIQGVFPSHSVPGWTPVPSQELHIHRFLKQEKVKWKNE